MAAAAPAATGAGCCGARGCWRPGLLAHLKGGGVQLLHALVDALQPLILGAGGLQDLLLLRGQAPGSCSAAAACPPPGPFAAHCSSCWTTRPRRPRQHFEGPAQLHRPGPNPRATAQLPPSSPPPTHPTSRATAQLPPTAPRPSRHGLASRSFPPASPHLLLQVGQLLLDVIHHRLQGRHVRRLRLRVQQVDVQVLGDGHLRMDGGEGWWWGVGGGGGCQLSGRSGCRHRACEGRPA